MKLFKYFIFIPFLFLAKTLFAQEDDPCNLNTPYLIASDSCAYTNGNMSGATASTITSFPCTGTGIIDVWYKVIVPTTVTSLVFEANASIGPIPVGNILYLYVYRGTCPLSSFTSLGCSVSPAPPPYITSFIVTGLVAGETLYVRIATSGSLGTFGTCVYNPLISGLTQVARQSIKIYPNPTNGIVNFNTELEGAATIELSNIFGQIVFRENLILQPQTKLNLSIIPAGIYVLTIRHHNRVYIKRLNISWF